MLVTRAECCGGDGADQNDRGDGDNMEICLFVLLYSQSRGRKMMEIREDLKDSIGGDG